MAFWQNGLQKYGHTMRSCQIENLSSQGKYSLIALGLIWIVQIFKSNKDGFTIANTNTI